MGDKSLNKNTSDISTQSTLSFLNNSSKSLINSDSMKSAIRSLRREWESSDESSSDDEFISPEATNNNTNEETLPNKRFLFKWEDKNSHNYLLNFTPPGSPTNRQLLRSYTLNPETRPLVSLKSIIELKKDLEYQNINELLIESFNNPEEKTFEYLINDISNSDTELYFTDFNNNKKNQISQAEDEYNNNKFVKLNKKLENFTWFNILIAGACTIFVFGGTPAIIATIILSIVPITNIIVVAVAICTVAVMLSCIGIKLFLSYKEKKALNIKNTNIQSINEEYTKQTSPKTLYENQNKIINILKDKFIEYKQCDNPKNIEELKQDIKRLEVTEEIKAFDNLIEINNDIIKINLERKQFRTTHQEDIVFIENIYITIKNYEKTIEREKEKLNNNNLSNDERVDIENKITNMQEEIIMEKENLILNSEKKNIYDQYHEKIEQLIELNKQKDNLWNKCKNILKKTFTINRNMNIAERLIIDRHSNKLDNNINKEYNKFINTNHLNNVNKEFGSSSKTIDQNKNKQLSQCCKSYGYKI